MNSDSSTTASLDSELVARAQRGDADAFATLFHTHKPRVYSLCLRMTNNTAEAERRYSGGLPAGLSQVGNFSRRLRSLDLAAPDCSEHRVDALSQEVVFTTLAG